MSEYIEEAYVALIASLKAELAAARARIAQLEAPRQPFGNNQSFANNQYGQGLNRVSALAQSDGA